MPIHIITPQPQTLHQPPPGVRQLATFWEAGATLETESEILAFTRFVIGIRKSLGPKDKRFLNSDVSQLLFAIKPPRG